MTGHNFLGNTTSHQSSKTYSAINPSTGETLPTLFFEATLAESNLAIEKAEQAFKFYRKKSTAERAIFLERIGEEILNLGDELIKRCMEETGLPEARLQGERGRTVNQLKLFAEVLREGSWLDARIDPALPDRQPLPRPDLRQIQIPLGPVGIFGASNFPLAFSIAGGDTASALAAGCCVVVKAHPAHPGTSELVGSAILRAAQKTEMPDGVFSLLHGTGIETGMAIVNHPLIKAIGFTGSFRGGKAIFEAANKRPEPIPVYAEMGSINPVFILPGALKERGEALAQGLANSVTLGVGQFCTNPGLILTMESENSTQFLEKTGTVISAINAGVMLSPGIQKNYYSGVTKLKESSGVEVLAQGKPATGSCSGEAYLLKTSSDVFYNNPALAEEVFGPSTLTVTASNKEDLYKLAENLHGHLTATLHANTEDLKEYGGLIDILERKVGRLIINGFPTGVEVCHAMVHGGPFPATTDSRTTSVGSSAIKRFSRGVCYQDFPQDVLPPELKNENPLGIWRMVNGKLTKDPI